MGNYISCTLAPPIIKNTRATRVIFPTGEVKQYKEQVNAAELMIECPTHFITNSKSLHIGRRFSALGADEELESGNIYVFFPMKRVNSIVTTTDVAVLCLAANMTAKRISSHKDLKSYDHSAPYVQNINDKVPRLSLEGVELGFRNRMSYCRSRKPMLETIDEEPIWLR